MEVCEWKKMSQDQLLIHLFAEASNQYMSKIAMEILSGPNPSVAILRAKVAETEKSLGPVYKLRGGIVLNSKMLSRVSSSTSARQWHQISPVKEL